VMNYHSSKHAESISILHNTFKKVLCFNSSHALKNIHYYLKINNAL